MAAKKGGACPLHEAAEEYSSKGGCQVTTKDCTTLLTHAGLMKKSGAFSSNNMDICFSKHKTKGKTTLTEDQLVEMMKDLCTQDKQDFDVVCEKLNKCKKKDHIKAKTSKTGGVDRMTDTSKYTGSHKERFDESGKGKGAAGRVDQVDDSGYVGNYKGEGTYDKK